MAHRVISTHILTKRMTMIRLLHAWRIVFQLTSSRRGWRDRHDLPPTLVYFNSHPHEEDDWQDTRIFRKIHTFQLTSSRRGWPKKRSKFTYFPSISTHILTKRMTTLSMSHRNLKENFNSHPHEEDDFHMKPCADTQEISTHILTKRMTIAICSATAESLFQLTSSRRGWQRIRTASIAIEYFNSHPHEEDDIDIASVIPPKIISTHILTKRMTRPIWCGM